MENENWIGLSIPDQYLEILGRKGERTLVLHGIKEDVKLSLISQAYKTYPPSEDLLVTLNPEVTYG